MEDDDGLRCSASCSCRLFTVLRSRVFDTKLELVLLFRSKYELTVLVKKISIYFSFMHMLIVTRNRSPSVQQRVHCEPRHGILTKRDAAIMLLNRVSVRLINERPLVSIHATTRNLRYASVFATDLTFILWAKNSHAVSNNIPNTHRRSSILCRLKD